MNDLISGTLGIGILGVVGLFGVYVFRTYVVPKKVEELAEMLKSGHLGPAIKKLQSMLEENPRDPYVHFLLAEAYYKQQNFQQAILEYNQVLKINKFSTNVREGAVRSRLGNIYLAQKNLDAAKKEFIILTKLEPNKAENFFQVGALFDQGGLAEKSLPYFKQAAKINRNHSPSFTAIGRIEYSSGKMQEAKMALTEAVKLDNANAEAHYYLAMCLKNQRDFDWAIREFEQALRDEEFKAKAYLGRAMCYIEKDNYGSAISESDKGLVLAQKGSEIELNLQYFKAMAAEKKRDFHTAIGAWERIISVNAKFKDVTRKLEEYAEFRTDDTIKDFLIASPGKFEALSRAMIESLEMSIMDLDVVSDSEVRIVATEAEGAWRNTKRSNHLIAIYRTTEPISERALRSLHEEMRNNNYARGLIFSTGDFTAGAKDYCTSRPIELCSKEQLTSALTTAGL